MTRNMSWWVWALGTGCVVGGGERDFDLEGIAGLRLELGSGDVDVVGGGEDGRTLVHTDGGGIGRDNVDPEVEELGGGWVSIDMNGGPFGGGDIDVVVPDGLPLEIEVARGDVQVELFAPADVWSCVAAGDIGLRLPSGAYALDLDGGAGSIDVRGVIDDPTSAFRIALCVGAGSIDVDALDSW